jgi:hypothetical protein
MLSCTERCVGLCYFEQALLDAMGASTSAGSEAVAVAERNADLITSRAGAGDPSAFPSILRIPAAAQYSSGSFSLPRLHFVFSQVCSIHTLIVLVSPFLEAFS